MNLLSFIVVILLLSVLIKQIQYIRKLKIRTRKSTYEIMTIIIGILVIMTTVIYFAKNYVHYWIALLGIVLLIVAWMKQGISDNGVLIIARGKELYRWNEIGYAKIKKDDFVIVDYYSSSGSIIISHRYLEKDIDEIFKIFHRTNFKYEEVM